MQEIESFRTHLIQLGYAKTSVNMLPNCLGEFLKFTSKALYSIAAKDILAYYAYLQERPNQRRAGGLSESFIYQHIYSLKLFFGWQLETGQLEVNPISSLSFPTPHSPAREILTREEITELYEATTTLKEKAVLALFYGCGLRRTEGQQLNLKDIHFREQLLYVRAGKGNKRRVIPLSGQVKQDLLQYVQYAREPSEGETALVTNHKGRRTSGNTYNRLLKQVLSRTCIEKTISLHCLRHSIATHLLECGLSVEYVRDFLGHKHLESTQVYTHIQNQQIWNINQTAPDSAAPTTPTAPPAPPSPTT